MIEKINLFIYIFLDKEEIIIVNKSNNSALIFVYLVF